VLAGQTPALRREGVVLLEQLGLGLGLRVWPQARDRAEVGRRPSLGGTEGLGPETLVAEEALGIRIVERVPLQPSTHKDNERYLKTKKDRFGHWLYL
jgi:hypothetical protein